MTAAGSQTWQIEAGGEQTSAVWEPPEGKTAEVVFICAHGAGGHMDDRSVVSITDALREHGCGTVRFNFFYRARGSARPDPMPRLLACFEAVIERVRSELSPEVLVLGGRSMGGRAASMLVAQGAACQGLLLLAYPLHPPGQPEKLRASHLGDIRIPVLCVNGTRDPFCDRALMEEVLSKVGGNWRMVWIEDGDHSFRVPKRSGRTRAVLEQIAATAGAWMGNLGS